MGTSAVVFGHWCHTIWEGGNVVEIPRTCLKVCVVWVVDSFGNNICLVEGMEDVGIGHFVAT